MSRSTASNVSLILLDGLMVLKVDVLACKKAEERIQTSYICPDEKDPIKPRQMYVHPDDIDATKGPVRRWLPSELPKAREIDGVLYPVTQEEIDAAKEPLIEKGEIAISIFPADEFEAVTRPGGAVYYLKPKSVPPVFSMLTDLVADRKRAFVGEMTIRDNQRLYRLEEWNGHLILQEHVRPGEFNDTEDYTVEYPKPLLAKMAKAVDAATQTFDPEAFASALRQRAIDFDAVQRDPNAKPVAKPKAAKKDSVDDLMALLDSVAK